MDEIWWTPIFWGVVGAVVVSLVALIVQELRDHARGERGEYWKEGLLQAEVDLLECQRIWAAKPRDSQEKA